MKSLDEIAFIIEGLKKEVEKLKKKYNYFSYPLYKINEKNLLVVKFTSINRGICVFKGDTEINITGTEKEWIEHTMANVWSDIAFDKERGLYDKQLVWCWNDFDKFGKSCRFYDAINKRTFCIVRGSRTGTEFENYELVKGNYPEWARISYTKLKD